MNNSGVKTSIREQISNPRRAVIAAVHTPVYMIERMDVIFLLRQKQSKKGLKIKVFCRITTDGPRTEFYTKIKLNSAAIWDPDKGEFFDFCALGRVRNLKLNAIRAELEAIQLNLHLQKLPYGPSTIKNIYLGKDIAKVTMLKACSEYLSSRQKEYAKGELEHGTILKDQLYYSRLKEFLESIKSPALLPQEFKIKIALDFRSWLNSSKTNTARHVEFYSRTLDFCIASGYIDVNPIASLKMGRNRDKKVVSLELSEVETMLQEKLHVEILQQATHLFLFQCGNGFAYGDLFSGKYRIIEKPEGNYFLGERYKGDQDYLIPVFPLSQAILNIYGGKLPFIDNRTYNRCLKQIAPMLGISKYLTTHVARKTFATLKDDEGWSLEAISRMLGHTSVKTTERHYLQKTNKRVIEELRRLGGAA